MVPKVVQLARVSGCTAFTVSPKLQVSRCCHALGSGLAAEGPRSQTLQCRRRWAVPSHSKARLHLPHRPRAPSVRLHGFVTQAAQSVVGGWVLQHSLGHYIALIKTVKCPND